jgi:hypothetical protein
MPSQIQFFRIFESLVDFLFNFKICILGLKAFKKKLSHKRVCMERELFGKSPKLPILKLNIKSTNDSKILKIWNQSQLF